MIVGDVAAAIGSVIETTANSVAQLMVSCPRRVLQPSFNGCSGPRLECFPSLVDQIYNLSRHVPI